MMSRYRGRMTWLKWLVGLMVLGVAMGAQAQAQDAGVRVWGVRVLATDVEAVALFYEKAFGMSEISRPVNSATTKEILINVGATPEIARRATAAPIAIYTRPKTAPAG